MAASGIVPIHTQVLFTVVVLTYLFMLLPAIYSVPSRKAVGRTINKLTVDAADDDTTSTDNGATGTSSTQRNLLRANDQVRLAIFGSSNAWGAALESRFDAYPYLLSPEVVNYADYSAGPNYASVCVNTIVGENEDFDAIILDYWLKSHEGLEQLAIRLRRRYPRAIMVFSRLWSPHTARRQPFEGSSDEMDIYEWKKSKGLEGSEYEETKRAIVADDGYWYFPNYSRADEIHEAAVRAVGGVHFEFPMRPTVKQTIIDYLGYFDEATHSHVSPRGHTAIARVMKKIIQVQFDIIHEDPTAIIDGHDGTWGRGDSCHLWLTSGGCAFDYSPNWNMVEYDQEDGKFALYVEDAGWIDVKNDFKDNRTLYLSFLATNENWYPETLVEFNGANGSVCMKLNPVTGLDYKHAHLTRTVAVGMISHGTTRIILTPQDTGTIQPFRLLGASLTNEEALPLEFSFGPAFNH